MARLGQTKLEEETSLEEYSAAALNLYKFTSGKTAEKDAEGYSMVDVNTVVSEASCRLNEAVQALMNNGGNLEDAIYTLTKSTEGDY